MDLQSELKTVLRTTRDHIQSLKEMGIITVEDLLLYLPRAHEDLSQMHTIASAPLEEKVTIMGTVDQIKLVRTRRGKQLVTAKFHDQEGGQANVVWFNQPHIKRMITEGQEVVLTGKLIEDGYKLQFQSPQFEKAGSRDLVHSGRLVPVYPQHDKINTIWLREKIALVKDVIDRIPETLPPDVIEEEHLMPRSEAIRCMHFPEEPEDVQRARDRFAFEEMFNVQQDAISRKMEWQGEAQERLKIPMDVQLIKDFFASLKFTPTNSQKIAIYEILRDMEKPEPMSRLLEGDVGSGKTLVATAVIANVIQHGGQCALMVPTEVLAKQHSESIAKTLRGFLPTTNVQLLTGSTPQKQAMEIKQSLARGTVDLVIGTHALIEETVQFNDLRFVIVDEQHRFGVVQRERLKDKGSPHFLSMTATPIPRTLALTAYGHHDLSVLLEKPGNRKPIHTKVVSPTDRRTVELFIDKEIEEGRQVFVICPLITDSENEEMLEIRSVQAEKKRLTEGFPHRNITMLHGKMTPAEKEQTMREFKEKKFDILVSTSVIEVGIDVPNATIIITEGSERFGLSQLHQFRGRVGRSDFKSHCFLFTTNPAQARSPRLKAMEQHDSGFQLAEIDLQLRGPGELYGFRQSGIPEIRFGGLMNPELVVRARRAAEKYLKVA